MMHDDDDLRYQPTELMSEQAEDEVTSYRKRSGLGVLVFFIILSIIAIGAAFYIFVSKSGEINKLELSLENLKKESTGKAKIDAEEISRLSKELKTATRKARDLGLEGKTANRELVKVRQELEKEKETSGILEKNLESSRNETEELENDIKLLREEYKKIDNKYEQLVTSNTKNLNELKSLQSKINSAEENADYWKRKYESQSRKQEAAVRDILSSARRQKARISELEDELYRAFIESERYYSLIAWEENYKLQKRVPLSKLTTQPRLISSSSPAYPASARNAGIEGTVILKGILGLDGTFEKIEVLYSPENNKALADAARITLQKYRYQPATRNGERVKVVLVERINFTLSGNR